MKIRKGFVSNSSTGSFIVQIEKDSFYEDERWIATEEQVNKLISYGFEPSSLHSPFFCNCRESKKEEYQKYMKYFVSCNEDEVIEFLLRNNIPFKAACHYDNEYYSYKKGDDFMWYGYNYGHTMCMYGEGTIEKNKEILKDILTEEVKEEREKGEKKIYIKEWLGEKNEF